MLFDKCQNDFTTEMGVMVEWFFVNSGLKWALGGIPYTKFNTNIDGLLQDCIISSVC